MFDLLSPNTPGVSPSGVVGIDSGDDGGSTLNDLAGLFGAIGGAVGTVYRAVNPTVAPRTGIPTSYALPAQTGSSNILLFIVIGIAVIFGIKMLRE